MTDQEIALTVADCLTGRRCRNGQHLTKTCLVLVHPDEAGYYCSLSCLAWHHEEQYPKAAGMIRGFQKAQALANRLGWTWFMLPEAHE